MTSQVELLAEARDLVIRLEAFAAGMDPEDIDAVALWSAAHALRERYGLGMGELGH